MVTTSSAPPVDPVIGLATFLSDPVKVEAAVGRYNQAKSDAEAAQKAAQEAQRTADARIQAAAAAEASAKASQGEIDKQKRQLEAHANGLTKREQELAQARQALAHDQAALDAAKVEQAKVVAAHQDVVKAVEAEKSRISALHADAANVVAAAEVRMAEAEARMDAVRMKVARVTAAWNSA